MFRRGEREIGDEREGRGEDIGGEVRWVKVVTAKTRGANSVSSTPLD